MKAQKKMHLVRCDATGNAVPNVSECGREIASRYLLAMIPRRQSRVCRSCLTSRRRWWRGLSLVQASLYHHSRPYPHPLACEGCAEAKRCNACGHRFGMIDERNRCTNGRCPDCHRRFCTEGGAIAPGHGTIHLYYVRKALEEDGTL